MLFSIIYGTELFKINFCQEDQSFRENNISQKPQEAFLAAFLVLQNFYFQALMAFEKSKKKQQIVL
jgi:hypothetical protein